jgi:hypothetical protein
MMSYRTSVLVDGDGSTAQGHFRDGDQLPYSWDAQSVGPVTTGYLGEASMVLVQKILSELAG